MKTPMYMKQMCRLLAVLLAVFAIAVRLGGGTAYSSDSATAIYFVDLVHGDDSSSDGLTDAAPVKTPARAAELAKAAGYTDITFVLMSDEGQPNYYNITPVITNAGYKNYNLRFVGAYEDTAYESKVYIQSTATFRSNLYFDYVTFTGMTGPSAAVTDGFWYLNGYNFYVDAHCKTDNSSWGAGELANHGIELSNWPRTTIVAGVNANGNSYNLPEGSGHSVTILSGRFGRVVGVNRGNKFNSGVEGHPFDENITIGGTAELALVVGASSEQYKVYSNPRITVNGGYIYRLVGSNFGFPIANSTTFQTHYGDTHITVNGGTIEQLVGSAMGRNTPYVRHYGDTYININGGTIGEVQGGGALGDNYGNIIINMTGGKVTPVHKYPIQSGAPLSNGNIYGGGSGISDLMNWSDISSGKVTSIGNTFGHVSINMTGGTVQGTIFGGGHGYDYKTQYGSDAFYNIAQVMNGTEVNVSGNAHVVGDVYGGGDGFAVSNLIAKVYPETSVSIKPNAVIIDGNVYGGGNHGLVDGNTEVHISQGTILNNVYGAASNSPVTGNVTVSVEENTHILGSLYGGGSNGVVGGDVNILIDKNVQIDGSIYGGGENRDVNGEVLIQIGDSSIIGNIYGGGKHGNIGEGATIVIGNNTTVSGSIHGGGENGNVGGDTTIHISEGAIIGDIYGGGDNGSVDGNTIITIEENTTVNGNIYGGGKAGTIGGDTSISIGSGSHIDGSIFGGGDSGNVGGDISITIDKNTEVGTVIGGCNSGEVGGNTSIVVNGPVLFTPTIGEIAVAGGGLNGKTDGDVSISLNDVTINGDVYDGGVGDSAIVNGSVTIDINRVNMADDTLFYVGGGSGSVYGDINISKDDSDITFKVSDDNSERPLDSFDGWKLENEDVKRIEVPGNEFTLPPGSYDMTVNWIETVVTLVFHRNGHGSGEMTDQKIIVGADTAIKSNGFASRFYMKGWALSGSAASITYRNGQTLRFSYDDLNDIRHDAERGYIIDLYAVWDDPRKEVVVKIPKVVILDGVTKEGMYSVWVKASTKTTNWTVSVKPDSEFVMKSDTKGAVNATVTQQTDAWDIGVDTTIEAINAGVTTTGKIKAPGMTAGQWHGTFRFRIEVILDEDKSNDSQ